MPSFRAVNQMDLILPAREGVIHKIRKLSRLPEDYDDLNYLDQRTDLVKPTSHLEVQDRVILVVERPGWQDIYEICCVRG